MAFTDVTRSILALQRTIEDELRALEAAVSDKEISRLEMSSKSLGERIRSAQDIVQQFEQWARERRT